MAAFLDECNKTSVTDVFVNDVTNKNEMEKKRGEQEQAATKSRDAAAAAKQAEEARLAREEAVAQQLKVANGKIEEMEKKRRDQEQATNKLRDAAKQAEEDRLAELEVKKKELDKIVKQHQDDVQSLNTQVAQANSQITTLQNEAAAKLASEQRAVLDPINNLPMSWNNKAVNFINAATKTALFTCGGKSTD